MRKLDRVFIGNVSNNECNLGLPPSSRDGIYDQLMEGGHDCGLAIKPALRVIIVLLRRSDLFHVVAPNSQPTIGKCMT